MFIGYTERIGEKRYIYTTLVGKPGGKSPLARPRLKWILDLKEVVNWKYMAQTGARGWIFMSRRCIIGAPKKLRISVNLYCCWPFSMKYLLP
jgi:hypothetical protein